MVADNLKVVREKILQAAQRSKRSLDAISIVAVTKAREAEEVLEASACGLNVFGENRVQEAAKKIAQTKDAKLTASWHLIGHLQTNKAKEAVKLFDLIQSIDSLRVAEAVNREAAKINKKQAILLEIKTSFEETKAGFSTQEVFAQIKQLKALTQLNLLGLMTIAPLVKYQEEARPYFKKLRMIFEEVNSLRLTVNPLSILSMGMSDDFEVAIEEGSNMIRLGRALFERKDE